MTKSTIGGAKSNRGGARPGAGRPRKTIPDPVLIAPLSPGLPPEPADMLDLLQRVALGQMDATALQVRAAVAAVQYTHTKRGDGGKKDEVAEKAKKVATSSRFKAAPSPLKLVNG